MKLLLKPFSYSRNAYLWKKLTIREQSRLYNSGAFIDPYKVLDLPPDADKASVKSAYLKLAKLYHPDKNPSDKDAKLKFEKIQNAYRYLMEQIAKSSDDPNHDEVPYDFTVQVLSIETHPLPTMLSSPGYLKLWIFGFVFMLFVLFKPEESGKQMFYKWRDEVVKENEIQNLVDERNVLARASKKRYEASTELNRTLSLFK